jgi:hypothetical protein
MIRRQRIRKIFVLPRKPANRTDLGRTVASVLRFGLESADWSYREKPQ